MDNSESKLHALRAAHLIERLGRLLRAEDYATGLQPAQWEALRYLSRANRFSRTPAALAEYLGTSRGTVSQTLVALEAKGLVAKGRSLRDGRSRLLELTAAGEALLAHASIQALADEIEAGADAALLAQELERTLRGTLARRNRRAFGQCRTCRHFLGEVREGTAPHHCALLDEPLSRADTELICAEQAA